MKRFLLVLVVIASACTPGGLPATGGGSAPVSTITKIDVSIAAFGQQSTPAGLALGFSPLVATLAVGSGVQFVNVDNTSHTASSLAGSTFPAASPLSFSATSPFGAALSSGWSTGTLQAGTSSSIVLVDRPGTYLYGCFFHYSGTMRGMIVAQ